MLLSKVSMADSHDKEQNIIDKAKEINKKIKENPNSNCEFSLLAFSEASWIPFSTIGAID